MDCAEVERLLSAQPLDSLAAAEREAAAGHLASCAACRERWDLAQQSQELYEAVRPSGDAARVRDAVMAQLDSGPDPASQPRRRLGGFELLGRLGRGGMGTVLKARQITMDRLVALKILPKRLAANEDYVKRFIREARAAARLRHPHIVQAFDVGRAEGYYFFAMEYVDGEPCDAILRREGPFEPARVLTILKQTASALAAAHDAGIVHRDIKPSNLMLDSKGDVRVTDFGLAKRTEGDIVITAEGGTLGTPAYVSPEMASGREADARSDLYSLGATAYHLLAGRPPFEGRNFSEVVVKQVNAPPPPLADAAPRVDPRLCAVVDRLLRKGPAERHPSAHALLDELEALGGLAPAGADPRAEAVASLQQAGTVPLSGGQKRLRDFEAAERRRSADRARRGRAVIVAGSAGLLLAVGLVVWLATRGRSRPQDHAVQPPPPSHAMAADPREARAAALHTDAVEGTARGDWRAVLHALDVLATQYADTRLVAANRAALGELRARAERTWRPKPSTQHAEPPNPKDPQWTLLFDGRTLDGWRIGQGGVFGTDGKATVQDGELVLGGGQRTTGIARIGDFPTTNYEVAWEAKRRTAERAELCNALVPIGRTHALLAVGPATGFIFLDGRYASSNPSCRVMSFDVGRWYRLRLRVTDARVMVWVDDREVIDVPLRHHVFRLPGGHEALLPFGLFIPARDPVALRGMRLRRLDPEPAPPDPAEGERLAKATVGVLARVGWADTGLDVREGSTYGLAATGHWGSGNGSRYGPQGVAGDPAPRGSPLPKAPSYSLVGRVGAGGRAFAVGPECSLAATASGRLFLAMNDPHPWDNWGMVRVAVDGPLVADRSAWLVERFTRVVGRVTVPALEEHVATDIEVRKGEVLLFESEGQWSVGDRACDADGLDTEGYNLRLGMLHASPAAQGGYQIGSFRVVEFLSPGKLELSVHDPNNKDNSGSITVTIRALEPPAVRPDAAPGP